MTDSSVHVSDTVPVTDTVLVIEDDPAVARALRRALEVASVDCCIASTAEEARSSGGRYKLAIVDVNLPDGNGIDLFDELLSGHRVDAGIFFTATDDERDRERATRLGSLVPKSQGVAAAVSLVMASLHES